MMKLPTCGNSIDVPSHLLIVLPEDNDFLSAATGVNPFGAAVGPILFLPDRHQFLEPVNRVPARLERLAAVRTTYRHRDTHFADIEMAQPMDHYDLADRPA